MPERSLPTMKNGGAVKVVVVTGENGKPVIGFEYPEGKVTPRPEKDVQEAAKKRKRKPRASYGRKAAKPPKSNGPTGGGGVRTVPKVPLVRA